MSTLVARATAAAPPVRNDHFHLDFLKRDLVVNQIKQSESAFLWHVVATQFNACFFPGELRMGAHHFAVEQERNVGVEFFLQLMEPLVRSVPRSRFMHRKEDLISLWVVSEEIDHGWIRNPRHCGLMLVLVLVLVIANRHMF